jgi:adenosylcobinamide-phosphate synthase
MKWSLFTFVIDFKWSLYALIIGFGIDLIIGDPHRFPHPVVFIGKLIGLLNRGLRKLFPGTAFGEKFAGAVLWTLVVLTSTLIPALLLWICHNISPWLRLVIESIMCWQILAVKSLRDESMKVYYGLKSGDITRSRHAVSMIVGRDTAKLDDAGVTRAAVETVAENTTDGIVAPLIFLAIGGAPLGFFYKAVNTMDSMLGYTKSPYRNIGLVPAKADDVANFIPARFSALLMLVAGWFLRLNVKNGWKIFCRDRFNHASPNSAQTESVCAGLLGIRLAGDFWYHGVYHKGQYIGDALREIEHEDIPRACRLSYGTAILALLLSCIIKLLIIL